MKLDAKSVAGLVLPEGKNEIVRWDDELPKFGLRLRRGDGRTLKTWVAQYRINGKVVKATFGDARVVSPSEARAAARKHLAEVSLGADPQAERVARRRAAELTFTRVVEAYLEDCRPRYRPNTFKRTVRYLTGPQYFKPLHAKGVSEIAFADIAACVRSIETARSSVVAHCARSAVHTFFAWTISEGLLGKEPRNPVIGTRNPPGSTPRDRVLSTEELIALWRETAGDIVRGVGGRHSELQRQSHSDNWRNFCNALRLMLLLGARHREITNMPWSELDLAAGTWTLPKERSKNKRPLTLVLPKAALDILAAQPRRSEYVFGGSTFRGGGLYISNTLKRALDRRLGDRMTTRWTPHDLRRSMATHLADLGTPPHVIDATQNHVRGGVSGTYNRSRYDREVTAALVCWSEHLLALVEGRAGANVIPLRGAS